MSAPYQPGDTVRLSTTFTVGGTLTSPTAVTLSVRDPAGTTTTPTPVNDSTGTYHYDYTAALPGLYAWKWTGTGTAAGIDEGTFTVEDTLLGAYLLCSVDDVKGYLELTNTDSDDLIQASVSAVSSILPERYQREFVGPSGGTRSFPVTGRLIDLAPYDLRSVGAVTLHPEETATVLAANSDYQLRPVGGYRMGGTYLHIRLSSRLELNSTLMREFGEAQLQVAGNWGCFSTGSVDESVKRAAVITAASWVDRAVADYGMAGEDPRELRPDRFGSYAIPFAAHAILSPWSRL